MGYNNTSRDKTQKPSELLFIDECEPTICISDLLIPLFANCLVTPWPNVDSKRPDHGC